MLRKIARSTPLLFACPCLLALVQLLATVEPLPAQSGSPLPMTPMQKPDPRLEAIHKNTSARLRTPSSVAVSPDGQMLAWTIGSAQGQTLHLTDLANPDPAREVIIAPESATNCSNTEPVWSPDSESLAFTSTCTGTQAKAGQAQLFLWSKATGKTHQLTHLSGIFHQAAFAPDGKSIAFLFVENASRNAGALAAMKPWSGVIGEDGVEIQRVYGVSIATGSGTFLTPLTLHVYEFDWAPSSKELAYIAADAPGENNWWVAQLWAAPIAAEGVPAQPRSVFNPNTTQTALRGLQIAVPRYSPDGTKLAFIGGLMSDQGSTGGDVWVVNAKGDGAVDVTPQIDGTPTYIAWTGNDAIGFVEERRGHDLLVDYSVSARKQDAQNDLGEVNVGGGPIKNAIGVSRNGVLAFVKSGHETAP